MIFVSVTETKYQGVKNFTLGTLWGVLVFPEILQNFSEHQIFLEFVLDSFSYFYIEIAYSSFTFCGS